MSFVPPKLPEGFRTVPNCKRAQARLQGSHSFVDIIFGNGARTDYTKARTWQWGVGEKLTQRRGYAIYAYRPCRPNKPL